MERAEDQVRGSRLRHQAEALDTQHRPPEGEAEAEDVARLVAGKPDALARSPLAHPASQRARIGALTELQRTHGNAYVQRMISGEASEASAVDEIRHRSGPGAPLGARSQDEMGGLFGGGMEHVRVHTDAEAGRMANELNAEAFTVGRDVYFGEGRFSPATTGGKSLLAHELTHVGQQVGFAPQVQRQATEEEEKPAPAGAATAPPTPVKPEEEETKA